MLGQIRRLFDPYIALMLVTVLAASLAPAKGVGATVAGDAANAAIVFLFFLYGARTSPGEAWRGLRQWRLHLAVLACTFGLFPVLGLILKAVAPAGWPTPLATGLVFLCVLPSTVQSSIAFTSIARGNVPAALCAASASNLIGVFLSPLLAGWLLHAQGLRLGPQAFGEIVLQLLAPFLAGQLLRRWIGAWVTANRRVLGFADRGSILLIIYVAFSKGVAANIWDQLKPLDLAFLIAALALLLALALVLTYALARYALRLELEDEIVLQFCGSKKSLATGLPMANVLFAGPQLGLVVLPLMLFHQLQLLVCAVLARRYAARHEREALPSESPVVVAPKSWRGAARWR
jgi:sodium/bile acid cotransporter 7